MTQSLEPIVPEEAVDQYLKLRGQDASESTIQNHRYRLKHFLKWCDHASIENLNGLSGRDCDNYKNWRIAQGDVADITLEQQLRSFKLFLRYCESIKAIETGISEELIIPKVSKGEAVQDDVITHEEACAIREDLRKYEYTSKEHVIFSILYHTGMRRGACVSLDVADWHSEDGYIEVQHRPDASVSTPLKLKQEGERNLSILDADLSEAMDDYLFHNSNDHKHRGDLSEAGHLEVYDESRYFGLTGDVYDGFTSVKSRPTVVREVMDDHLPKPTSSFSRASRSL